MFRWMVLVAAAILLAGCGGLTHHAKPAANSPRPSPSGELAGSPPVTAAPTPFDLMPPSGENDTALYNQVYAACNWSYSTTAGCDAASIAALQAAMAGEGLAPLQFPADFWALPYTAQELFLVNGERTARDLPALTESAALDADAVGGAEAQIDPTGPASGQWWGTWAGADNTVYNDFWMVYNDGYGSNQDCVAGNTSGCWGHRDNILAVGATEFGSACVVEPQAGFLPFLSCAELLT